MNLFTTNIKISKECEIGLNTVNKTIEYIIENYNLEDVLDYTDFSYEYKENIYSISKDLFILVLFNLPNTDNVKNKRLLYIAKFNDIDVKRKSNKIELPKEYNELIKNIAGEEDLKLVENLEREISTFISYGLEYQAIKSMMGSKYKNKTYKLVLKDNSCINLAL